MIPEAFKKQIMKRFVFVLIFLAISIRAAANGMEWRMFLSAVLCGCAMLISTIHLYKKALAGRYIRLQGSCIKIEYSGFRKRIKYIYLKLEKGVIRIPVKERINNLVTGDTVTVYFSNMEIVYQEDDLFMISDYYALEY